MIHFSKELVFLFSEMAPFLLLGMTVAGVLRWVFTDEWLLKTFGTGKFKSVFLAALFGIPLPLCSCGVIPTATSLYRRGMSPGATVSFLTATPQTGIDSIAVTYGFLGWPLTIFKLVAALITGVFSGSVAAMFSHSTHEHESKKSVISRLNSFKEFVTYSYYDMVIELRKWLILGVLLAAGISTLLPNDITQVLGGGYSNIVLYLIILLISVPLYVCATASVPIAAALIMKGFPPGAALVFLMAGPATNAATLTAVWKLLGKRNAFIYAGTIACMSFGFGFLFDMIYANYTVTSVMKHHNHLVWWHVLGAVILFGLIINSYVATWRLTRKSFENVKNIVLSYQINGMTCEGCVKKVTTALLTLDDVSDVALNVSGECQLKLKSGVDHLSFENLEHTINELGYQIRLL